MRRQNLESRFHAPENPSQAGLLVTKTVLFAGEGTAGYPLLHALVSGFFLHNIQERTSVDVSIEIFKKTFERRIKETFDPISCVR